MKYIFTLAILVCNCCITQIYSQEKNEIPVTTTSGSKIKNTKIDERAWVSIEQMPQFPGGDAELMKFIKENLKCPKSMSDNCIEGQVIVRFVVSEDGSVKDVQVLRSLDTDCDKEAVRLVESMPKWIPGKQNGKPVDVYYTLPVRFKLEDAVKFNK